MTHPIEKQVAIARIDADRYEKRCAVLKKRLAAIRTAAGEETDS